MQKIRLIKTGEVKEVTPNVAFDLIDRGLAKPYKPSGYKTTDLQAEGSKKYRTK